jgi:hypothetical protein
MQIRDRIKRFDRVYGHRIIDNPKNWREHSQAQQDALSAILAEIGFAGALLVRETPEGLMLIDGHLRKSIVVDQLVPVLVLDVDEAEADKLLLTFDPISAMAEANKDKLDALLRETQTNNEALLSLYSQLAEDNGIIPPNFEPVGIDEQGALDKKNKITCPNCGHEF